LRRRRWAPSIIEKHITLSRSMPGPDHAVSLEPLEFKALVYAVRNVEKAPGRLDARNRRTEQDVARAARGACLPHGIFPQGTVLLPEMVARGVRERAFRRPCWMN
jgi:sialic acid synthase SpsE